jgi:hypothetical protein
VDQPLFSDVDIFVRDLPFELFDLKPCCWKHQGVDDPKATEKGRIIFADAVYFRDPDWLLEREDPELIRRSILCFLAYDFARTARYCLEQAVKRKLFPGLDYMGLDRYFA